MAVGAEQRVYRVIGEPGKRRGRDVSRDALNRYARLYERGFLSQGEWKAMKESALERRKVATVSSRRRVRRGFSRRLSTLVDCFFWQFMLSLGGVGMFLLVFPRLKWSAGSPDWGTLVGVALGLQLIPAFLFLVSRMIPIREIYRRSLVYVALLFVGASAFVSTQVYQGNDAPSWLTEVAKPALKDVEIEGETSREKILRELAYNY
ncbi:MAG: hypothetical protein AAGC74_07590 [Verrucomicrobiota bacterium]